MIVTVTDLTGEKHTYDGEDVNFETEDMTNNLEVKSDSKYVVFAQGAWIKCEQDIDG